MMDEDFIHNIKTGPSIRIRKVIYTGHASTIYSVDNAVQILDYIGQKTKSEDVLPFALRLVEGDDLIEIAEDNNEFACGELLAQILDRYEGYNMIVCVSRQVEGCYVSDMIQHLKSRIVKEAAIAALDILYGQLKTESMKKPPLNQSNCESGYPQITEIDPSLQPRSSTKTSSSVASLKQKIIKAPITLDPFSDPILEPSGHKKLHATRGKLAKLQHHINANPNPN